VRHFQKVIEDSRERQEQLKIVLANSEKYQKNIEDSLEKHAEGLRRVLKERFDDYRNQVDIIEEGLLSQVNSYMDSVKAKINESIQTDTELKQTILEKIKELESEKIGPNFIQYIREDLPASKLKVDSVLLHEYYSMCSPQRFQKRLDELLDGLVGQAYLFKFPYTSDNFNAYMRRSCFATQDMFKSEANFTFKQENHKLTIMLRDSPTTTEIPLIKLKSVTKVHMNLQTYSNITSNKEWSEMVNTLNFLWEALPNMKKLKFRFQAGPKPMDTLGHMFSSTFWNDKKVPMKVEITNSTEECRLAELFSVVLPRLGHVKKLNMQLRSRDKFTDRNIETLVNYNENTLKNLENFSLILDGHAVTDKSMMKLLTSLPSLKVFKLYLWRTKASDSSIEHFAQNALLEMKGLEHFELSLIGAKFTDQSICQLFVPMRYVRIFRLFLEQTEVTEKIMEAFIENTLFSMEGLEDFELRVRETKVVDENLGKLLSKMPAIGKFKVMLNSGSLLESQTELEEYNNGSKKSILKRIFAI